MHIPLASRWTSAFLVIVASRLPRWLFRGLPGVHSHCGPQNPLASYEAFSRSASAHLLPPGPPLVLPAGARVGRVGFAPTNQPCLRKAHTIDQERNSAACRAKHPGVRFEPMIIREHICPHPAIPGAKRAFRLRVPGPECRAHGVRDHVHADKRVPIGCATGSGPGVFCTHS